MSWTLSDADKAYLIETSVVGRMLDEVSKQHGVNDVFVFGCGTGDLAIFLRGWLQQARITGYDIDTAKIAEAIKRLSSDFDPRQVYTTQRPVSQFDVVIAGHVLHHGAEELSREAVSYIKPGGVIGVVDYDMKEMARDNFFRRWGLISDERRELERLGPDQSYRLHTSFGLDDCVELMRNLGMQHVSSQGKIEMKLREGLPILPIVDFYYVGAKSLEQQ